MYEGRSAAPISGNLRAITGGTHGAVNLYAIANANHQLSMLRYLVQYISSIFLIRLLTSDVIGDRSLLSLIFVYPLVELSFSSFIFNTARKTR